VRVTSGPLGWSYLEIRSEERLRTLRETLARGSGSPLSRSTTSDLQSAVSWAGIAPDGGMAIALRGTGWHRLGDLLNGCGFVKRMSVEGGTSTRWSEVWAIDRVALHGLTGSHVTAWLGLSQSRVSVRSVSTSQSTSSKTKEK
jgi:hypothetical protein